MLRSKTALALPSLLTFALSVLVAWAAMRPFIDRSTPAAAIGEELPKSVERVDRSLEEKWAAAAIAPAEDADELTVLRRLSLSLVGTIPSLEEVRAFEKDAAPRRLERWTARFIEDWRFVEYFGDRLASALVSDADDDFGDRYRQRFVEWLGRSIQQGRPYDVIVRQMIAARGYWADDSAVLFVGSDFIGKDEPDIERAPQRLASRASRAFIGQQIGCAECHDHPFAAWKQSQFEQLAAHFGQLQYTSRGFQEDESKTFVIDDERKQEKQLVAPGVPFDEQNRPATGAPREQLAEWITHRDNRRFRRATVNRVWGLMFGRPYVQPVDDLPDPLPAGEADETELLDVLGDDWAAHGYDLRRLIEAIAACRAFRLASTHPWLVSESPDKIETLARSWAVFPITQLTPAQLTRSLWQAASLKTLRIREESSSFAYLTSRETAKRSMERYGEVGDMNETHQTSSVPQAVLRLTGADVRQAGDATLASAAGRIATMAAGDADRLEASYLVCLTRRPVEEERLHFLSQFDRPESQSRSQIVEDIFWTLFNSAEFHWNH